MSKKAGEMCAVDISQHYSRQAREHGRDIRACGYFSVSSFLARQKIFVKMLAPLRGKRILDIGCGHGLMTAPFARQNVMTGLDLSFEMLRLAGKDLQPVQGNAGYLPFQDASFDVVLGIEWIQHVANPVPFLKEMMRVTSPGGELVVSSLCANSLFHTTMKMKGGYQGLYFHDFKNIWRFLAPEVDRRQTVFSAFPFPFAWEEGKIPLPSFLASSWIIRGIKKAVLQGTRL